MNRIQRLPDQVINQIAAGEVVERPGAVVKELMENALDAGASLVEVEVGEGGEEISVVDNGCGMSGEDALLSLERHATSKIRSFEDLEKVCSFGFRGEALPSIAAVSHLLLQSREGGSLQGVSLEIDNGKMVKEGPCGKSAGTAVRVSHLFANVPARKKFLKSAVTEMGHCVSVFKQIAMSRPDVHFILRKDQKTLLQCPCQSQKERVAQLLEKEMQSRVGSHDLSELLMAVELRRGEGSVGGWIGAPSLAAPISRGFYLFVNGRGVWDSGARRALIDAYGTLIERQKTPLAVLFLELPPSWVDVNVHPAKREVRFSDKARIYQWIYQAVREALESQAFSNRIGSGKWEEASGVPRAILSPLLFERRAPSHWPALTLEGMVAPEKIESLGIFEREMDRERGSEKLEFSTLKLIGQVACRYIACEGRDHLYLIDQHAAHEHILFERFKAGWNFATEKGLPSQYLISPLLLELSPEELALCRKHQDAFQRIGFDLEELSGGVLHLRAVPATLIGRDSAAVFKDILECCEEKEVEGSFSEVLQPVLATLACQSAVRFGEEMSLQEMRSLLVELDKVEAPRHCPHGRPILVEWPFSEIDRRLKRL